MSHSRLAVITSHMRTMYDMKATEAGGEAPFVWNPPASEAVIEGGETITVRAMKEDDLEQCLNLLRTRQILDFAESDITCAMRYPGFTGIVAVNKDKRIIGCLMIMIYRSDVRTKGNAIVHQSYRKRGISKVMTLYSIDWCPVVGDFGDYEEFVYSIKKKMSRYEGGGYYSSDKNDCFVRVIGTFKDTFSASNCHEIIVKSLEPEHLHDLLEYDRKVHVIDRESFIRAVCGHEASRTYVAYCQNKFCGYGILRKCYLSHKISPLFADNPDVARALYQNIAQDTPPGCRIVMIVPMQNQSAIEIIEENEFSVVHEVWRLRQRFDNENRKKLNINYNNVFSVTDLNLTLC